MQELIFNPMFGIVLSIGAYLGASMISKKSKQAWLNPLLLAIFACILFLHACGIPLEAYQCGGNVIGMFLLPATALLSLNIYRQRRLLFGNLAPVLIGCFVGSGISIGSIFLLSGLFGLQETVSLSLVPKSVTTPIALELSEKLGGIPAITMAAVLLTGIFGAMISPVLIKLFRVENRLAAGLAIGTSSHAVGTAKALELGEIEGAMSSIAISIAGIFTVIFCMLF